LRTPSAMNGAFQKNMLWNGQFGATGENIGTEGSWTAGTPKEKNHLGFEGLETQAIAGLVVHRLNINEDILNIHPYKILFDAAFADIPEADRYTRTTAGLAIAAFERTVMADRAPFQKWLQGDHSAMTESQKAGALLFFDKAECFTCHTGPALNKMDFMAIGMGDLFECGEQTFRAPENDPAYLGRGGFTGDASENYRFKVPQLYNLKDSPFFGHGATFKTVEAVVDYKNQAVSQNPNVPASQLDPLFVPLGLNQHEIDQITDFVENGLYDPELLRYAPVTLPSGNCFPVNDLLGRLDLSCD
ncbi:MAG: cytochrome-c peroxidase, partial [Saprospiraceae bacterium]|nr:cytochrome-c peroxidase [Saprospiraceae bacterium]